MIPLDTTTGTTSPTKWIAGVLFSVISPLFPLKSLAIVLLVFIAVDFITGIVASWHRGEGFCSKKMWRTIYKTVFAQAGIVLAFLLDEIVLMPAVGTQLHLARFFTVFVCGTEFWSFLENASEISHHPIFIFVRKLMTNKFKEATGEDLNEVINNSSDNEQK